MIITCQTLQSLQDFWDFAITEINTQSSKITGGPCNFSKLPGIFCTFWSRLVILHHHNADSAKPLFDLHALNMSTAKTSHLQTSLQKTKKLQFVAISTIQVFFCIQKALCKLHCKFWMSNIFGCNSHKKDSEQSCTDWLCKMIPIGILLDCRITCCLYHIKCWR